MDLAPSPLDQHLSGVRRAGEEIASILDRADVLARYPRLLAGLHLLQAQSVFTVPNDGARGNQHSRKKLPLPTVGTASLRKKSPASQALTLAGKPCPGFLAFVEATGIKQATAYNLMNAALNTGLTVASTPDDVEALRSAGAVDHLTGAEWRARYVSALPAPDSPPPPRHTPEQLSFRFVADTLTTVREQTDIIIQLAEQHQLSDKARDAAAARLHRALEHLTGSPWRPAPGADPYEVTFNEDPEVYRLGH